MISLIQSIPRVSNTEGAGDQRPDQGGDDPDQDGELDGDVLAAGEHQSAQRPNDEPDDDGTEDQSEHVVFLKAGSDRGCVPHRSTFHPGGPRTPNGGPVSWTPRGGPV